MAAHLFTLRILFMTNATIKHTEREERKKSYVDFQIYYEMAKKKSENIIIDQM